MLLVVLVFSLALAAMGQRVDDDWVDPYDMLNYDASTQTMRKNPQSEHYDKVATKRREHVQDTSQTELTLCSNKVADLTRQIDEQKKKITLISQQPTCNPVFKRFLSRLLKEIQRVGVPMDSSDVFYDAAIKLSSQAATEIKTFLEGEDNWQTGALDSAISQILVDLKQHNHEAWKWRFEDTFAVELDTVLKVGLFILIMMAIICTELWSIVSWFVQFRRLFAVSFLVSLVWNWFYLYKIAFAEHQNNIVKMNDFNEKCTGLKKMHWTDSLKEWYRSTLTLQDDPCKNYYEVLFIEPWLLVPPTKAISVTITTTITEPLKHFGQGISEFLRALLKDLPVTLQIPVLLAIMLVILVFIYVTVQAVFQHGITAPLRGPRHHPPPPELEQQQQRQLQRNAGHDHLAVQDVPQQGPRQRVNGGRNQRHPNRPREEQARMVETLQAASPAYSEDEIDAERLAVRPEGENRISAVSDSENQQIQVEAAEVRASCVTAKKDDAKTKHTQSDPSQSNAEPTSDNVSQDQPSRDNAAHRSHSAEGQPTITDKVTEDRTASGLVTHVETVGFPVQETSSAPADSQ